MIYYYCVKIDRMAGEKTLFTVEQIDIIEKLRAVLSAAKAENLNILVLEIMKYRPSKMQQESRMFH